MSGPLERLLAGVSARVRVQHALHAGAAGAFVASLASLAVAFVGGVNARVIAAVATAILVSTWIFVSMRQRRSRHAAALLIERADPALKNLVVTAEELLSQPDRTRAYMRARVLAEAADRSAQLSASSIIPLTRAIAIAFGAAALALAVAAGVPGRLARSRTASSSGAPATAPATVRDLTVDVDVVPPSYTARPAVHLRNPTAIESIAGSRATITLTGVSAAVDPRVRVNGANLSMRRLPDSRVADITLTESGYLAVDHGVGGARRLIPISVIPDRAPDVRITAPARDLRITSPRSIAIEAKAQDDLALASMEVRYTKISGTGEQFEFQEGTLPTSIDRSSGSAWRATAQLPLSAMKLEPGDALVYRAVARDRRPGDEGLGTSDTYFVEVAGPGEVALAGFDMPPDRERYALSQQMIVLKIERLHARERAMSRPAIHEAAANIAAEQRAVRANFVFLLGGTIEDEEVEARESTEIAEGRFENRARQEILAATRLMTRAEQALSAASTSTALPPAREAAQALQRAFGHSRYLLRALPQRGRIDPSRRLTGDRASAADWRRGSTAVSQEASVAAAREALNDLLRIAAAVANDSGVAERPVVERASADLAQLAERVLRVEPSAADLQAASRELLAAREALSSGRSIEMHAALERAAAPLLSRAQRGRIDPTARSPLLERLAGALPSEGAGR